MNDSILLLDKGIDKKLIFFYQVWKEMTDVLTMDSYQYKVMNTLSCIRELVEVLDKRLMRVYTTNHNVKECKEEALSIIRNDLVLKKYYLNQYNTLLRHIGDKTETDAQLRALRYQLEYIYEEIIPDYANKMFLELEFVINNNQKRDIISITNRIISTCISNGWSANALSNTINILCNDKDKNGWEVFKGRILEKQAKQYNVLIPITVRFNLDKGDGNDDKHIQRIEEFGVDVIQGAQVKGKYNFLNRYSQSKRYIDMPVIAFDYYSASHRALSQYADILNMLSFYNVIEAWSIKDISWIVIDCKSEKSKKLKPRDLYSTYAYVDGSNRLLKESLNIFSESSKLMGRLKAVFSYTNMSKASYSIEEKYINIWVALESLCRGDIYDNIITNVLETVPAALCNRYIYKKIRNFVEDCRRCEVDFFFKNVEYNIAEPDKKTLVANTILVLRDDVMSLELIDKCKVNSLLEYRCRELKSLVSNEMAMVDSIQNHYLNVRRQVSRLYRLRNDIAHTAAIEDVRIVRYIEHIEDYLAELTTEIIQYSRYKNNQQIELIFEMIKDNYKQFEEYARTKSITNTPLSKGLFKSGIINLV